MGSADEDGDTKRQSDDFLYHFTTFMDRYVRESKWVAYGMGTVGIVLVLRGIHATAVFSSAKDIPLRFINNRVRLRGKVASLQADGTLLVNHRPLLNVRPKWLQRFYKTKPLPVELAFLCVSPHGRQWLGQNVVGKKILFQPLEVQEKLDTVWAAVYLQKVWRSTCVNEELVKLGLCKISAEAEQQMSQMSAAQTELLEKLIGLESVASKNETGMWKGREPQPSRVKSLFGGLANVVSPFKKTQSLVDSNGGLEKTVSPFKKVPSLADGYGKGTLSTVGIISVLRSFGKIGKTVLTLPWKLVKTTTKFFRNLSK